MSIFFDIWDKWFGNHKPRYLMLGLEGSGKLTILLKTKLGEYYPSIPEIDYEYCKFTISAFHVGGKYTNNPIWRHYLNNVKVIIFVIDSSDADRIEESCNELHKILEEDKLKDAALLVYANKQDLPNAISGQELKNRLGLEAVQNRVWHVQELCANTADGLYEGFDWINEHLNKLTNK